MISVARPRRAARRLALPVAALALAASVAWTQPAHATQPGDSWIASNVSELQAALSSISADLDQGKVDDYRITVQSSTPLVLASPLELSPNSVPAGASVAIGASGTVVIDGGGATSLLDLDGNQAGGLNVSISGITFQNGLDATDSGGGAAIIAGSASGGPADTLNVANSTFSHNETTGANSPGGAIQFIGGQLSVDNSTFQGDATTDSSSSGGDIYYSAVGTAGQGLSVQNDTFANSRSAGSGGAIDAVGPAGSSTGVLLQNNTFTATTAAGPGGAVYLEGGLANSQDNTFSQTTSDYSVAGGAQLQSKWDFFQGGAQAVGALDASASISVNDAWWGCDTGPNTTGCATASVPSGATITPYLTISAASTPGMLAPGGTAQLAAHFQQSGGPTVAISALPAIASTLSSWSLATSGAGSVSPLSLANVAQVQGVSTTYTAGSGPGTVDFDFLGATGVQFALSVAAPPSFTSTPASIPAVAGTPYSSTVSYAGTSAAVTEVSGPAWINVTDLGNGSATISGTPSTTDAGTDSLVLHVSSSWGSADVTIPVTVSTAAVFSLQPQSATVAPGADVVFSVAVSGTPTPTIQWQSSSDSGASWSPIAGATSPTLDLGAVATELSGTEYRAEASNAAGSVGSAVATLLVGTAPVIDAPATLLVGQNGLQPADFTVSGSGTIAVTAGPLPTGVSLSDLGGGTWELQTATPGLPSTSTVTLTATSEFGSTSQQARLIVGSEPVILTQPSSATALAGDSVTFGAAGAGSPTLVVQWQMSTDGGVSFTDIPGANSATLSLTATAAENGTQYRAVISNGFGAATTDAATLTVHTPPAFASGTPTDASFTRGVTGGSTTVTATGELPLALSVTGALPAGIRFTDNGDGTGTFSGTTTVEPGSFPVTVTAHNGFGADATLDFAVTVAAVTPPALPNPLPLNSDGALGGVPSFLHPGDSVTVTGSGFAPFSTVALGVYSAPTPLGTATADASGAVSATVTLPAALAVGQVHTLAAVGLAPSGAVRTLAASFTLLAVASTTPAGTVSSGAAPSAPATVPPSSQGTLPAALAATGAAQHGGELLLIALALLAAGALVLLRHRRRIRPASSQP